MHRSMFPLLATIVLLAGFASADSLSLSYTVSGTGGVSQPVSGFSNTSFWWADTSGGVSGSVLTALGFDLVPPGPGGTPYYFNSGSTGSLLFSSVLTMSGESLTVDFAGMTVAGLPPLNQADFALLVQNSQVVAILADVAPNGVNHIYDFGPMPGTLYPNPSPGVTTTASSTPLSTDIPLGDTDYGNSSSSGGYCKVGIQNCMIQVSSTYTPAPGQYQLVFGAYDLVGNNLPSAVAVESVTVPEGGSSLEMILVAMAMCSMAIVIRRRKAVAQSKS